MSVKIGKLLPDGHIRHIEVFYGGTSTATAFNLKNFYTTEKRVDALLDLGNLNRIGSSPYGRCADRYDCVHCDAAIRDNGANKKKNEASSSMSRETFKQSAEACYLYENGKWTVFAGKHTGSIDDVEILKHAGQTPLANLEIYEFDKDNRFSKIRTEFSSWSEMQTHADSENKTLYVFRNNRLVTTINHPLHKKEIA